MFKMMMITLTGVCLLMLVSCVKEDQTKKDKIPQVDINFTRTWLPPAGSATIAYNSESPFLKIFDNIDVKDIQNVSQGRELFIAEWNIAPGSRVLLDGLGPMFNAKACVSCHISNGRINPYNENGSLHDSFLFRIGNNESQTHPILGKQLQTRGTTGYVEGNITWTKNNGVISFSDNANIVNDGFNLGPRISPHLLGMGLLNLVEEHTIIEFEDLNDDNKDGISGRVHWVTEGNKRKIGRFGWKAINSNLRTQNAGALSEDMGLTTTINPKENCTSEQEICATQANGGSPEVSDASLDAIVSFMTALGVPDRRIINQDKFDNGANIFDEIGCALCHRPTLRTGVSEKFKALTHQTLYAYTDLLLHDMGDELSDGVVEKNASSKEWRTPPLWGIGIVEKKEGALFLHDGRAKSIDAAIIYHGGEAKIVKEKYLELNEEKKNALLEFLRGI